LWSAGSINYRAFVDYTERVKELTDGRVVITPYPAGAIVPTYEALDAVQAGVLEGHNEWPGYFAGKDPVFACLGGLMVSFDRLSQFYTWFQQLGGLEMLREAYADHGLYVMGVTWWGFESLPSKVPLRKIEDFEGLKMRSPGGMSSDVYAAFGASLIVLPGEEVYTALEKGVIDCTDWSTPITNYEYGHHEVCKYFTWPGFHQAACGDISVRMEEWNKLPDDLKAILETASREAGHELNERLMVADFDAVDKMIAAGNVPIAWEQSEIKRLRAAAAKVWDEWAAKNDECFRAVESQKDFMKKLGLLE